MVIESKLDDGRTLLEATVGGVRLWRIAPSPRMVEKKRILLERDIALAEKGIFPRSL